MNYKKNLNYFHSSDKWYYIGLPIGILGCILFVGALFFFFLIPYQMPVGIILTAIGASIAFLPYARCSKESEIDEAILQTAPGSEKVEEEDTSVPTMTIEELELSVRAYNCLKRASINSMAELLQKSEHDLLNIKNFGKKSSDEVIERLRDFGLDLAPNPEGVDIEELI